MVDLDAIALGDESAEFENTGAILDTGTTLAILPQADAEAIHAAIPGSQSDGQGGFTIPCNSKSVVSLSFGGKAFDVDPRDLAFQPLSRDPNGDCVSGIAGAPNGAVGNANEWLVGDTFLKNAYFSTDVEKNTLSLASLV